MKKRRNISRMISYGSIAACLVIAVGVGVLFMDNKSFEQDIDQIGNIIAEENDNATAGERNDIQEKPESYVDVSMLLASNEGVEKQVLEFACVEVGEFPAIYYKAASVKSSILKESIGSKVEGTQNWYKVSGHEDLQYLISGDNNEYSLWEFNSFQKVNYAYKIETIEEKSDDCTNQGNIQDEAVAEGTEKNESAGKVTSDAPVNENTYREVRDYSAELTDLQNRVSQVMMDKELPFVISSAILKNPDRLHVIVKTKDEDMIAKLKAFDTTGELLEIEYSESTPVKELLGSKGE